MQYGIVYLLTNPCVPGLVKIGMTTQEDIDNYFEVASSDEIVDLKPSTKGERRKVDISKGKSKSSRSTIFKTPAKVIYTPMGNKR